jgi:hypothetical protein
MAGSAKFLLHLGESLDLAMQEGKGGGDAKRISAEWVRQPTMVETNCQNLISDIQKPLNARSGQAGNLAEIKGVQSLLVDCKYMHVHRGGNEVAHTLAQHARRCHENAVVRLEAPECVRELIRREAAGRVTPAYACNRSVP